MKNISFYFTGMTFKWKRKRTYFPSPHNCKQIKDSCLARRYNCINHTGIVTKEDNTEGVSAVYPA